MLIEDFKNDMNNTLKEMQENMGKQVEALKGETQKSLKQEKTNKQVKELNKTTQDLKIEVEIIKKSQRQTILEIQKQGKKSDVSINNRIHGIYPKNFRCKR